MRVHVAGRVTRPFVIRAAAAHDVPQVAEVCTRATRAAYAGLVSQDYLARVIAHWYGHARLLRELAPSAGWFGFAVAVTDRVVGVAGAGLASVMCEADAGLGAPPACELYTLYVDPGWQRRGVGRALIAHVQQQAVQARAGRLLVAVLPGNTAAAAFYQACGFTPAGRRPIYAPHGAEGGPASALVFTRDVQPGGISVLPRAARR